MSVGTVGGRTGVEAALRGAAEAVGVDFDYLLRTAKRESALDPRAKARTSSAAGLFQFIEGTWLGTLKKHGAKHGYGAVADLIGRGPDGRLRVADAAARQRVLDLRFDPKAAALMGAELTADHAAYLRGRIGREPTGGELYVAHFMGPAGSAKLIEAAERSPGAVAARLFPAAAAANRPIFHPKGRAASVAEVYANLTRTGGGEAPAAARRTEAKATVSAVEPSFAGAVRLSGPREVLARMERARRDDLMIDMILGKSAGGQGWASSPFSTELLTLLSGAIRR